MQTLESLLQRSPDEGSCAEDLLPWATLAGAGVTVATFAGFDDENRFLVACGGDAEAVPAASTIGLREADRGAQVAIALEGGDARRPVILGKLHRVAEPMRSIPFATVDGDRLVL
jgi:hypothetical protein